MRTCKCAETDGSNLCYSIALVPNLGINYLNWVTGPFDLGNGRFLISVLTTTYFIDHKLAEKNRPNRGFN